jgi:dihydroneopterin aldolase
MLASVKSLEEAHIALECDVDIIDLKNPAQGALGALPKETVRQVVRVVEGRKWVSATIGDVPMEPGLIAKRAFDMADTWVDFLKIGFFAAQPKTQRQCIHELVDLACGTRLVGVLFANLQPDLSLLKDFRQTGFAAVMLDTSDKTQGRLTRHMDLDHLGEFITLSRELGLMVGLAGSIQLEDIPTLTGLRPDFLGFRGALCAAGDRTQSIRARQVAAIQAQLRQTRPARAQAASLAA